MIIDIIDIFIISIAITPRRKEGCYSIPWIAPFYPWSLPYNGEC